MRAIDLKYSILSIMLILSPALPYATASGRELEVGHLVGFSTSANIVQREDEVAELREAIALMQAGKLDDAEVIVRRVTAARPRNSDAHNLLGVILDQRKRFTEAETEYREALMLNPKAVSAQTNLGVLLARAGRSKEAIPYFESVLRQVPDHPQATFNLGLQYSALGDYTRAAPLFERLNLMRPRTFEYLFNLGVALYQLKRYDEAASALNSAAELTSTTAAAEPLYYLGLIASERNQSEEAVEFWQRAIELRPNLSGALFMIGEELKKQRRYEGAAEFYERALKQDSSKLIYYVRLGGVYMLLVRYDAALAIFQLAAERFPGVAEAHYFVAVAARGRGSFDIAEAALRKSISLRADNADALAQLGFIVGERSEFTEAESLLRRAISLEPKHFYAHYDLGRLLVKTRRYEEAITPLQSGAALCAGNPGVHYQLFMALSRLKKKEESDRELELFKRLEDERKKGAIEDTGCGSINGDVKSP